MDCILCVQIDGIIVEHLAPQVTREEENLAQTAGLHVKQARSEAEAYAATSTCRTHVQSTLVLDVVCAIACIHKAEGELVPAGDLILADKAEYLADTYLLQRGEEFQM